MFHKEGSKIILITLLLVVGVIFLSDFISITWLKNAVLILAIFFLVMVLQFFRNPKRDVDNSDNHILAPVDGKVVVIKKYLNQSILKTKD